MGGHYIEFLKMSEVQDFCRRLRVSAAVNSQALEYSRLGELKCPRGSISSSCMAAICIELAATQLKEPLDKVCVLWLGMCSRVLVLMVTEPSGL